MIVRNLRNLFVLCAALSISTFLSCGVKTEVQAKGAGKKGGDGVPVTLAKVTEKDVPVEVQVIGNVEAYSTISVKAQVGGELTKVFFQEGDYVKKGDLLFVIDTRPYEVAMRQAEANTAKDAATLSQAEANLARDMAQESYSKSQADRFYALFQQGIISKDQADQYRTNASVTSAAVNADRAAVESARAQVVASRAMVESAKVSLSYTTIRSPIEGRTGNLNVKQGNLVAANSIEMMTINQVQPIYVTFSVPEAYLPDIKKYMAQGKLQVVATPQEDQAAAQTGVLTFIDNQVDPTTGTIKMKGTFVNAERKLWPGQFVRVRLRLTTQHAALVVPNQAVQTGQDGTYVYRVKDDRTVEALPVQVGPRMDQLLVIAKGLDLGDTIVTDGQLRLAPGMRIAVRGERKGGKGGKGGPPAGGGEGAGAQQSGAPAASQKAGDNPARPEGKKGPEGGKSKE